MPKLIRRSIVVASLVFYPFCSFSAPGATPPVFKEGLSVTNLASTLQAFNSSGDLLLMVTDSDGVSTPAIVRNGVEQSLGQTGSNQAVFANGISNRRENGNVFATGIVTKDGFQRAALWDVAADGTFNFKVAPNLVLPPESTAPGEQSRGYGMAVNKAGTIVGAGSANVAVVALRWSATDYTAMTFGLGTASSFIDINEAGVMLANGVEYDHGGEFGRFTAALVNPDGSTQEIPVFDKVAGFLRNDAKMLRGEWVVGNGIQNGAARPYAWKLGASALSALPNPAFAPNDPGIVGVAINSAGIAVGQFTYGPSSGQTILWAQNGSAFTGYRLGDLVPESSYAATMADQVLINDAGQVALQTQGFRETVIRILDPVHDGLVYFTAKFGSVQEGDGFAEFVVRLDRSPENSGVVTVRYATADETAVSPGNYTALNGTLAWAAGESGPKTIRIPITDNLVYDESKTFKLHLSDPTGAQLGKTTEANEFISDPAQRVIVGNELAIDIFNVAVAVLQGESQVVVQLERTGGTDGHLTVTNFHSFDSSAHLGQDFELPAGLSLDWAPGEGGVKTVSIPLLNNPNGGQSASRNFTLVADANLEGATFGLQVYANVSILPSSTQAQPQIKSDLLKALSGVIDLSAIGVQGTTLELLKASALEGPYVKIAEAQFENGEVKFEAPIGSLSGAGFFRLQVKP